VGVVEDRADLYLSGDVHPDLDSLFVTLFNAVSAPVLPRLLAHHVAGHLASRHSIRKDRTKARYGLLSHRPRAPFFDKRVAEVLGDARSKIGELHRADERLNMIVEVLPVLADRRRL
jgi:hypothetical protein